MVEAFEWEWESGRETGVLADSWEMGPDGVQACGELASLGILRVGPGTVFIPRYWLIIWIPAPYSRPPGFNPLGVSAGILRFSTS